MKITCTFDTDTHKVVPIEPTAEMMKLLASVGSSLVTDADTTIVTIGNHASGLTGRITCTSGLIAALTRFDMPATRPSGTAKIVASTKPAATVSSDVNIWSTNVGGPV